MNIAFHKYHGTGNDFILIDNRNLVFDRSWNRRVADYCDRRFGIGADGLMLLQEKKGLDFEMVYYNADGNESSMCGNGGRCIVAFARHLGLIREKARFIAIDGEHEALIRRDGVSLKMNDVKSMEAAPSFYFLNTGSPHYVRFVSDIENYDVLAEGRKIRYSDRFKEKGTNVNFIEMQDENVFVRTYERGVEAETYSCGTGVTAAALVVSEKGLLGDTDHCSIKTLGGDLNVKFKKNAAGSYSDIWLEGPATFVFKGEISI